MSGTSRCASNEGDRSLYDWFATTQKPNPMTVDGVLALADSHGTRVATWKFINGFPVKWEGPDFDGEKNELAIETIEIAHEELTREDDKKEP